jgi:hypothetical protein
VYVLIKEMMEEDLSKLEDKQQELYFQLQLRLRKNMKDTVSCVIIVFFFSNISE